MKQNNKEPSSNRLSTCAIPAPGCRKAARGKLVCDPPVASSSRGLDTFENKSTGKRWKRHETVRLIDDAPSVLAQEIR